MNYLVMSVYTDHEIISVADFLYVELTPSFLNYLTFRANTFSKLNLPGEVMGITLRLDDTMQPVLVNNFDLSYELLCGSEYLVVDYMPTEMTEIVEEATVNIEFDTKGNFCFTGWNKHAVSFHTESVHVADELSKPKVTFINQKTVNALATA